MRMMVALTTGQWQHRTAHFVTDGGFRSVLCSGVQPAEASVLSSLGANALACTYCSFYLGQHINYTTRRVVCSMPEGNA